MIRVMWSFIHPIFKWRCSIELNPKPFETGGPFPSLMFEVGNLPGAFANILSAKPTPDANGIVWRMEALGYRYDGMLDNSSIHVFTYGSKEGKKCKEEPSSAQ